MSKLSTRTEKLLAAGLSAMITLGTIWVAYMIVEFGRYWLQPLRPTLRWDAVLFTYAAYLGIIAWTDIPEIVRQSRPIRTQVQCLTLWQILLALFVLFTLNQVSTTAVYSLFGLALPLIAYSAGEAYRAVRAK